MRILAGWLRGAVVAVALAAASTVPVSAAEKLDGYWMDSHGEVILDIRRCGRARCGKVAWLRKPRGPNGGPLRDFRNSDPKLRRRFVCGLYVVKGFKKQSGGTWGDGTVYIPDHGMTVSGYAQILGSNRVKVTGYFLLPIFGSSEVWTRVMGEIPTCAEQAEMIKTNSWIADLSVWRAKRSSSKEKKPAPPVAAR
ncbi:MAG: DUF2147 domain-containing protein [Hyphomicrobium sp.]